MKRIFKQLTSIVLPLAIFSNTMVSTAQNISTFDDLSLQPNTFWTGTEDKDGFTSGEAYFYNTPDGWGGRFGFIYSNKQDVTTEGYTNPASAFTGKGVYGSSNYAVAYDEAGIKLTGSLKGKTVSGFFITNTTYTALSMKKGDSFSKKFGGVSGNDPDWYKITITGYLDNVEKSSKVDFYLADFRFDNNSMDYIIDTWKWVDLKGLGNIDSLSFSYSSSDVGEWGMNTPKYFAIDNFNDPLFAPAAGVSGTSAMHKDSLAFKGWATACTVERGPQNISNTSLGNASVGDHTLALGKAGSNGVVSLGDGGSAVLTFDHPIVNGTGNDFAIFENGFASGELYYLELAYVEVSSDGINYFRFPASSYTDATVQTGSFGLMDPRKINNLAGKYVAGYGTPFDLEELKDVSGLDVNNITHIKIIDVVGSIDPLYARYDAYGNKINDPWPTAFASGGFDLDAVGVINQSVFAGLGSQKYDDKISVYPNPASSSQEVSVTVNSASTESTLQVFDHSGAIVFENIITGSLSKFSMEGLSSGIYLVKLVNEENVVTRKLVIN